MEKVVNAKIKVGFQPPSETRKIDFKYSKKYKPLIKKNKDNAY